MRPFVVACLTVVYSVSAIACAGSNSPDSAGTISEHNPALREAFAEGVRTGVDCMVTNELWRRSTVQSARVCKDTVNDLQERGDAW